MGEFLLMAVMLGSAFFVGWASAQIHQLRHHRRLMDAWKFDIEFVEYPENIHRSAAYKTASEMWLEASGGPFRRRQR